VKVTVCNTQAIEFHGKAGCANPGDLSLKGWTFSIMQRHVTRFPWYVVTAFSLKISSMLIGSTGSPSKLIEFARACVFSRKLF
jgi:hypothetical protein